MLERLCLCILIPPSVCDPSQHSPNKPIHSLPQVALPISLSTQLHPEFMFYTVYVQYFPLRGSRSTFAGRPRLAVAAPAHTKQRISIKWGKRAQQSQPKET